jgi:hypothetical protein
MVGENRIFPSHSDRMFGLRSVHLSCHDKPYIMHNTIRPAQHRMSAMWVLGENLIFSPLFAYSSTPRATRNTLKPSSLVNSLHAM